MRDPLSWLMGAVVVLGFTVNAVLAEGQQGPAYTSREVAIARLCVNEASWSAHDRAAIAYAREHMTEAQIRRTHRRALDPNRSDGRRWIAGLSADGTEPEGWPADMEWGTYQRRWMVLVEVVHRVLDGHRPAACTERPSAWGGRRVDAERLARIMANGGREVCTGTVNAFVRFGGGR